MPLTVIRGLAPLGGGANPVLRFDLDASHEPVRLALALTIPGRHDGHRYRAHS
jgi:hypothetical protein